MGQVRGIKTNRNFLQAEGRIVICYLSVGSVEDWRDDAAMFPDSIVGEPLEGWPGERWLDIRQIPLLAPALSRRLDLAVEKGCDGVEADNVDGHVNASGFRITAADQVEFNRWLADEAHRRRLSIGLKNDLTQATDLVEWFDWVLVEECVEFDECSGVAPFVAAGKAAFGAEYSAAYLPLVILSIGQLVNAGTGSVAYLLNMSGHEQDTMRVYFVAALVNAVLNFILVPKYGMFGAATQEQRLREALAELGAIEAATVDEDDLRQALGLFDPVWDALLPRERIRVLHLLLRRVDYRDGKLGLSFRPTGIRTLAAETASNRENPGRAAEIGRSNPPMK